MPGYGISYLFRNKEQELLYEFIEECGSISAGDLIEYEEIEEMVTKGNKKIDNTRKKKVARLIGRIRVLRDRLESRGYSLPIDDEVSHAVK